MNSLTGKIRELKKKRNAVILVHNYQRPELQDIADFLGDSLGLSQQAAQTGADVIVFCGVYFMAETAAILSPNKKVLVPEPDAGCPMADMIDRPSLVALKQQHPGVPVVTYVNSTAAIKAESDACCTSANALKVVNAINAPKIIFVPDQYLGTWVAGQTIKEMVLWRGYCPTHVRIRPEHIQQLRKENPDAVVMVHPECIPEVTALADKVLSTEGMSRFARETEAKKIIVGTEVGMIYRLAKENPKKAFIPALVAASCPNMKRNTLEKVVWALEEMKTEVKVDENVREKAKKAIDAMLEYGRAD
jgi:quinolinate synthase